LNGSRIADSDIKQFGPLIRKAAVPQGLGNRLVVATSGRAPTRNSLELLIDIDHVFPALKERTAAQPENEPAGVDSVWDKSLSQS
jgi:hypothetical protein